MDNCDHSTNRLDKEESEEFDKLFKKFCDIGRWDMAMSQFKKFMHKNFHLDWRLSDGERKVAEATWVGSLRWVLEKVQEAQSNEKTMQDILEEIIEEVGD